MKKDIVVLYHGHCVDGFGAALAAWKKFGNEAEYIPVRHGHAAPEGLTGHEVYLLDFAYNTIEQMDAVRAGTKRFVVLDHHEGPRAAIESVPEHVYDKDRSGATLAWSYFHPGTPVPKLLQFIEDGDLYRHALPETRDVFSVLSVLPHNFHEWDAILAQLEDPAGREKFMEKARIYTEYFLHLANVAIGAAKLVRFEGYECYFANSHPSMTMKSYIGHELAKKKGPIALIVSAHPDGFGVSIRGDGTVNVADIAAKFGSSGHPNSAGFFIPAGSELPWEEITPEA